MNECWLISVPNQTISSDTMKDLKEGISCTKNDLSECYEFELPSDLLVGTLNSLMSLSDDLHRVDLSMESIVRKIERQFNDLNQGDETLTVDGVPVDRYLNYFAWDEAKHPHRRPLAEIVSIIQANMGKVEDELKQLSSMYGDKKQQFMQMERKKGGNLMVANLDELLTSDIVSEKDFINTEYLKTVVVVVPSQLEEEWMETYTTIGDGIAEFGPEGNRSSIKGSPVVPNSARKLMEEGDSILYSIILLKGQYQAGCIDQEGAFEQGRKIDYIESYKIAAREKRFMMREFTFHASARADAERLKAELNVEVDRLWSGLLRWCKAHFGETFIAWMHIKAIRIFVESVLRYGLPVNFAVALLRPYKGKEKKIRQWLAKRYGHLQPMEIEEDNTSSGAVSASSDFYPYVSNTFTPLS